MFMVWSKQSARKTEKKAIRNALASKTNLFSFAFFVKRRSARGERKGESRVSECSFPRHAVLCKYSHPAVKRLKNIQEQENVIHTSVHL